ncbi:IPT/TIG domain-containing protein [Jatrophihabitans endophyticus]|uniref:IPT/TIG domain-containing protein n=1 Tax=Jatrophihabitans endophyticus TaxID=1206085 RepID=UPI0019F72E08|nr:IPT/TIG domain-containing protein [Jatrophihabitans endophyticus]MBE7187561.1 IPT/TIG domain-containing protein [Jatrophihabitans endophyticus]
MLAAGAVGLATVAAVSVAVVVPAMASSRPVVTGMSAHRGAYWGGTSVTVHGRNLTGVETVAFGRSTAWSVRSMSPTELVVTAPWHDYGQVFVRVTTAAGRSQRSSAAAFTYRRPSMHDPIQGGLTARQEQRRSAKVRAHHKHVHIAHRSRHWTAAMGASAVRRAASWIGVPYSWDGGNGSGPTRGACAHNGGDLDCHIVGFDCSGLALYSWWPYEHLVHYAATQHSEAGRYHPSIKQLVPGDLVYFAGWPGATIDHTAIYAGKGMVIQAPESGEEVMRSRLVDVIAASGAYRGATRPLTSGRQGSGPVVTSVTRTVSSAGGTLVVTGHGLTGVTSVTVAGSIDYTFASRSSHRVVLRLPAHAAGKVSVAVANAWGTVHRSTTFVAAPTLTALSPSSGSTVGGTLVTVHGHHLTDGTTATVGGHHVGLRVLSPTRATLSMPAHAAGTVRVVLHSAVGSSAPLVFTYVAPTTPPTTSAPPTTTAPPTTSAPPTTTAPPTTSAPPTTTAPPTTGAPSTSRSRSGSIPSASVPVSATTTSG